MLEANQASSDFTKVARISSFSKIVRLLGVLLFYAVKSGSVHGWKDQTSLTNAKGRKVHTLQQRRSG
jgi:hypothetical protein